MKLFQQLLVAGTALSMITPIGVLANDFNLEGMDSYARSKKKPKRFDNNSFTNNVANINSENRLLLGSISSRTYSEIN